MKLFYILLSALLLNACSTSDVVVYENAEYLKVIETGSGPSKFYIGDGVADIAYVVESKESGYDVYDFWLVSVGRKRDKNTVVNSAKVVINNTHTSFDVEKDQLIRSIDGYGALLLGSIDFNSLQYKNAKGVDKIFIYVNYDVNGKRVVKKYELNKVVHKMVNYPT